ncbi:MAG: hypothetical protein HYY45_20815 [Deltaproteobacteria bacterium]|nr:hypothetical protein [Deltaproteobacteria bacterium]
MGSLFSPGWENHFREWLNSSPDFQSGARWFDGSVLLGMGDEILWLKIYDGRVIDAKPHPTPLGFTFALEASEESWRALLQEDRNEILSYTGARKVAVEGNLLEFMRLTKTVIVLVDGMRALFRDPKIGKNIG